MKIPLAERLFMKDKRLESKMVIGGMGVIATKKEKRKKKTDRRQKKKRKMVKTEADAAYAQSMEILQLNTMSSSSYTDTYVFTLEYQSQNRLDFPTLARNVIDTEFQVEQLLHLPVLFYKTLELCTKE
ncbi:hypothetical protein AVEN_164708-1 [Araneus ventricosus]|uniref:Uncharacterized protein n=1 Tax=Araneus ventricosus TaxID=182803 RepID=A0A4Y2HK21_ARAVE|nr:hypothetical protein AVEN_164708-1 [Araneus ventricosus]